MQIGNFTLTKDGGWMGFIHTLTINTKIRLVPNDDRTGDNAPAFRVLIGNSKAGCAWEVRTPGNAPKNYLSVRIDDPTLDEPINAALFPSESGHAAELVWRRKEPDRRTNGKAT